MGYRVGSLGLLISVDHDQHRVSSRPTGVASGEYLAHLHRAPVSFAEIASARQWIWYSMGESNPSFPP